MLPLFRHVLAACLAWLALWLAWPAAAAQTPAGSGTGAAAAQPAGPAC